MLFDVQQEESLIRVEKDVGVDGASGGSPS